MPAPGVTLAELDAAVDAAIAGFVAEGVEPSELERAKTRLVAEAVYAQDSQVSLARWYGSSLATGQTIARRAGLAGAHRGGDRRRRCIGGGQATGSTGAAPSPAILTHRRAARRPDAAAKPMLRGNALMNQRMAPPAPPTSAVNVREIVSPGGVKAWLVEDYAVPIVSLELAFRGGATQDPQGRGGATTILSGLLDEGAGDLDSQAFHRALDEKAIEIGFHADSRQGRRAHAHALPSISTAPARCWRWRSTRRASTRSRSSACASR